MFKYNILTHFKNKISQIFLSFKAGNQEETIATVAVLF